MPVSGGGIGESVVRVTIVGALGMRAGRPSFTAKAENADGIIELDSSASAKLAGARAGAVSISALDGSRAPIEEAATRLYNTGHAIPLAEDGRWHLVLSALDLD